MTAEEENNPGESPAKSELLDTLEIRERKYIEGRLSGKSKMQAALDAGYTESMAAKAGDKIDGIHKIHVLECLIVQIHNAVAQCGFNERIVR